jgi:hypothetical protein
MEKMPTLGECALAVVVLAAVIATGYGALSLVCQRAFMVAGLN